jgi:uncharacterized membrane protein
MTEFLSAVAAFLVTHLVPSVPPLRARLVQLMGRRVYLALYSLLSVILLGWIIVAAQRADTVPLWLSARWQWWLAIAIMPFAFWFVIAGLIGRNPLSITLRASPPDQQPGAIITFARHPVLVGFFLWAAAHLPANGDLVSLVLFGGMALLAAGGVVLVDARTRRRLGIGTWERLAARTSIIPFAALIGGRTKPRFDLELAFATILSVAIYLWFLFIGHRAVIGPDPLAPL